MRVPLILLIILHGLIHFMGFSRAFAIGDLAEFEKELSKPMGVLWLFAGLLFFIAAALFFLKKGIWPLFAMVAVIISQFLIFATWSDTKYATIINVLILVIAIIGLASDRFESNFKEDVLLAIGTTPKTIEAVTAKDVESLPLIVQRYLNYVGVVGKPKIHSVRIEFEGEMREKENAWFKFTSEQFNFFDAPTRLFFMKAWVKGLPTVGYHSYGKQGARMLIKLASLFPIVNIDTPEMFSTETVTFFNDLCLFAPAALIDNRISWEVIDALSVKATFTTNATSVSAILYFNEIGQLVNFVSNDRYSVSEMKLFPFSTPVKQFKKINGYNLPFYGEAIWHYPEGEFVYGKFNLKRIEYNVKM